MTGFRVIVFSSLPPIEPYLLMDRLEKEVAGVEVVGLVYERQPSQTLLQRVKVWRRHLYDPGYLPYVWDRIVKSLAEPCQAAGRILLRLAQASSVRPVSRNALSIEELSAICDEQHWGFYLTPDLHSPESLKFVSSQTPDLGIVLGKRILKPSLYNLPQLGSVNIHKRKAPDYRGGCPLGLWELLDCQTEIGVTAHRVEEKVDTGAVIRAAAIRIESYDTPKSLALKADVIGAGFCGG